MKEKQFEPEKTILLIDGSSFLYRAYYSMRPLHTSDGEPVHAVYGFCRMIKKLMDRFHPQNMVLVWDSKGKTERHEEYKEYKATRQPPPSDIFDQKEYVLEFADAIGLLQVAESGIEADDIIYSLAKEFTQKNYNAVVISSDKDLQQMISDNVVVFDPGKEELIDQTAFEKRRGFPVEKLPFYFALVGDSVDNIPGVRGIGKQGASELVGQFDSLKDLYANLNKVKKARMRTALEKHKDDAFLSEKLFKLIYHKTGVTKDDISFDLQRWVDARPLFEKFAFKSLLRGLGVEPEKRAPLSKKTGYSFVAVIDQERLDEVCAAIAKHKEFAFDTETTGVRPLYVTCVGISICVKKGTAYYIPFGHQGEQEQLTIADVNGPAKPLQLPVDTVVDALGPFFENKKIKKYAHNAKFDMLVLSTLGIEMHGLAFDTMVAASLVTKDWQRIGLKPLSEEWLGEPMQLYKHVVKDHGYADFSFVPLGAATEYAAADAHQTLQLVDLMRKELKKQKLQQLYDEIEQPLIPVLCQMEKEGIACDADMLHILGKYAAAKLSAVRKKIIDNVAKKYADINLNSPKQLGELFFTHLKLPPQKRSAKGTGYSTDHEVLETLATMHPVPGWILKYRELYKLKSTYIDALPNFIHPETGRIHTSFSQTTAATGRLASSEPNLQNIPTDSGIRGLHVRSAFKPRRGYTFLSADYSQIELRVLAHLSQDTTLIESFLQGHDIHARTAAALFDLDIRKVSHDQRQIGKRINFSILYGLTPYGLAKDLDIPQKEAKEYIEKFFAQYPGVSKWMEGVIKDTKKHGYVTTFWGRRRYMPGIYEKNRPLYELARRTAINTRAQGTAAEIMKKGMTRCAEELERKKLGAKILLQIHDELLISVPKDKKEQTEKIVAKILETVVDWDVPLEVTTRFGSDWQKVTK